MDSIQKALAKVPDKTYYRIGEVARYTGLKAYVLRFWEIEFKVMMPPKSRSKQRMYRRKDIETILTIKQLLYKERFTIEGARRRLLEMSRQGRDPDRHRGGARPRCSAIRALRAAGAPRTPTPRKGATCRSRSSRTGAAPSSSAASQSEHRRGDRAS